MDTDLGKKLFSFTIDGSMPRKDFLRMGRAVRYSDFHKFTPFVIVGVFASMMLSLMVTPFFLLLALAIAVQVVVYMELSSQSIATILQKKCPMEYEFYEDGLIENIKGKSNTILYSKFKKVKSNQYLFTLAGKGNDVVVVPRSLLDKDAESKLFKLQRILG